MSNNPRSPLSGVASDYTQKFENFCDKIQDGYDKAVEKYNELVDKLNSWGTRWKIVAIGGPAGGPALGYLIKRAMDKLSKALDNFLNWVNSLLEHKMPIVAMIKQSFNWTEDVKGPITNLHSEMGSPASDNLYHWTGPAKLAYSDKAKAMQAAVSECANRAEFISEWLFTVVKSNVQYVTDMLKITTNLIGKVVDACAQAGSFVGLAGITDTIGEAAGEIAEDTLNHLLEIGERLIDQMGNVRQVEGTLNSHESLPKGHWPQVIAQRSPVFPGYGAVP